MNKIGYVDKWKLIFYSTFLHGTLSIHPEEFEIQNKVSRIMESLNKVTTKEDLSNWVKSVNVFLDSSYSLPTMVGYWGPNFLNIIKSFPYLLPDNKVFPLATPYGEEVFASLTKMQEKFGFKFVKITGMSSEKAILMLDKVTRDLDCFADLLNIKPNKIGNNYLSISFDGNGSIGDSNKSFGAVFLPGCAQLYFKINEGWGGFAHEWIHALDYYFGTEIFNYVPDKYMLKQGFSSTQFSNLLPPYSNKIGLQHSLLNVLPTNFVNKMQELGRIPFKIQDDDQKKLSRCHDFLAYLNTITFPTEQSDKKFKIFKNTYEKWLERLAFPLSEKNIEEWVGWHNHFRGWILSKEFLLWNEKDRLFLLLEFLHYKTIFGEIETSNWWAWSLSLDEQIGVYYTSPTEMISRFFEIFILNLIEDNNKIEMFNKSFIVNGILKGDIFYPHDVGEQDIVLNWMGQMWSIFKDEWIARNN